MKLLRPFLQPLIKAGAVTGRPLYLVGGAVRDEWLGAAVSDFDIAVPEKAEECAEEFLKLAQGKKLVALDEERKIFRVLLITPKKRLQFDFTNFKGKTIAEDLSRRDFTINAMACPIESPGKKNSLLDPFGGLQDLRRKTIRALSAQNLAEDPLRMLRAYRLAAGLGFKIEKKTSRWIKTLSPRIRRASPERIRQELMQMMATDRAAAALKAMDETRLLTALFPPLERSRNLARAYYANGGVLGHVLESAACFEENHRNLKRIYPKIYKSLSEYMETPLSGGFPRYASLKLITLLHDVAKPHCAKKIGGRLRFFGHDEKGAKLFERIGKALRMSNDEIELGSKIIRAHLRPGNLSENPTVSDKALYRFFRDLGPDGVGVLVTALADHQSYMTKSKRTSLKEPSIRTIHFMLHRYYQESAKVVPPRIINGHEVMKTLGIAPGREVGKILEAVRAAQAENKIQTKEQALAYLRGQFLKTKTSKP